MRLPAVGLQFRLLRMQVCLQAPDKGGVPVTRGARRGTQGREVRWRVCSGERVCVVVQRVKGRVTLVTT